MDKRYRHVDQRGLNNRGGKRAKKSAERKRRKFVLYLNELETLALQKQVLAKGFCLSEVVRQFISAALVRAKLDAKTWQQFEEEARAQ